MTERRVIGQSESETRRQAIRERLGLRDGQFFAYFINKNLIWTLNGERFGFGDIRIEDVGRIREGLNENEVFEGWNEHHGTRWQQTDVPMVRITSELVTYPHRNKAQRRQ